MIEEEIRQELMNTGRLVMTVCTHCGGYPDEDTIMNTRDTGDCAECSGRGYHIHVSYSELKNFDELSKYTLTD